MEGGNNLNRMNLVHTGKVGEDGSVLPDDLEGTLSFFYPASNSLLDSETVMTVKQDRFCTCLGK